MFGWCWKVCGYTRVERKPSKEALFISVFQSEFKVQIRWIQRAFDSQVNMEKDFSDAVTQHAPRKSKKLMMILHLSSSLWVHLNLTFRIPAAKILLLAPLRGVDLCVTSTLKNPMSSFLALLSKSRAMPENICISRYNNLFGIETMNLHIYNIYLYVYICSEEQRHQKIVQNTRSWVILKALCK